MEGVTWLGASDEPPSTPRPRRRSPPTTGQPATSDVVRQPNVAGTNGDPPLVLVLTGSIGRDDIPDLCDCVRLFLNGERGEVLVCDVGAVASPDAVTVDALARLQLTARRAGCSVLLLHAGPELLDLLDLMGLANVMSPCSDLSLESRGQAEQFKEPRGVEKEGDPGNAPG
jgi:ABC-type transporter Mla MlaB component